MDFDSASLAVAREQSELQIKNLNLFNFIVIDFRKSDDAHPDHLICEVVVVEKWYYWPIPFIEFADRNFNQWYALDLNPARTNYGVYFFNYNVRGRNQTLKLSFVTGYTRDLGIYYRVPFTSWNNKIGYHLESHFRRNREIWYTTIDNKLQFLRDLNVDMVKRYLNSGSLFYRIDKRTHVFLSGGYNHIVVNDTLLNEDVNPKYLNNGTTQDEYYASVWYTKEARDNRLFPWKGHYMDIGYSAMVIDNLHTVLHQVRGKISGYKPFGKNWAVAGATIFKISNLRAAPYRNFKSLGYSNNVRGYENYVIEGQHFGLVKTGLRYSLLNERTSVWKFIPIKNYQYLPVSMYVDLFADAGYVVNTSNYMRNSLQNQWLLGTGIGLNMAFYFDKVFRFEFTRNHLNQFGYYLHFNKSF